MDTGEPSVVFFGKAGMLRRKRDRSGGVQSDSDHNRNFARHLSPDYDIQRGMLRTMNETDTLTLGRTGEIVHAEMKSSRDKAG